VTLATQQWMRVLMEARPLLRNSRHRTMITPVNPPRLRLIHISMSYQTVCRSFEIILEWVLSIGLEFKSNVLCKPIASKKHSIWYQLNWKIPNCRGQLGLQWMSPSKERANVFERAVVANDISWFTSPANFTRKANMKWKCMNTDNAQWKEPELTTLISEVGGSTNTQSMQARILQA